MWLELPNALCREEKVPTELFFGSESERPAERDLRIKMAKAVCDRCLDRQPCLKWAKANDERGVWGGTTEQERLRSGEHMSRLPATSELPHDWLIVAEEDGVVLRKTRQKLNRYWEVVVDGLPRFSHPLESEGWIAWNRAVEARMRP